MRWSTEYISSVLFMGTRKSFSPTESSIEVLKSFAYTIGLWSSHGFGFSQNGRPIMTSRWKIVSLVDHWVSRLESPAWLTRQR
jgi:hypothetical protein